MEGTQAWTTSPSSASTLSLPCCLEQFALFLRTLLPFQMASGVLDMERLMSIPLFFLSQIATRNSADWDSSISHLFSLSEATSLRLSSAWLGAGLYSWLADGCFSLCPHMTSALYLLGYEYFLKSLLKKRHLHDIISHGNPSKTPPPPSSHRLTGLQHKNLVAHQL